MKPIACVLLMMSVLGGCTDEKADPAAAAGTPEPAPSAPAPAPAAPAPLADIIQATDAYIVGVSFAPGLDGHPGLAKLVRGHAEQSRAELMDAVEAFGNDKPPAPYELSLSYALALETPDLVVVAADGSRYTGGAHGEPIVERFVWLVKQGRLLTASDLVADEGSWTDIGDYVREQLHTAVSLRADEDGVPPEDRSRLVREADKNIRDGTMPEAENFRSFEPRVDAGGKITALRFIFPPYQVGPYADGTQAVEVPAEVLLPHVAPEYVELFARS